METLQGYVEHIIFRNTDNGYSVFEYVTEEGPETVVGTFALLSEGEHLEIRGDYVDHSTYGHQFSAVSYSTVQPKDTFAMERYLGSGVIKGIGASLASRIVRRFGDDTFRIIDEEPERLAEIKGISTKKAMEIADQMVKMRQVREAMVYLQSFGLSLALSMRVFNYYGENVYAVIRDNPYQLATDVDGVGFKKADEIALKAGFAMDADFRIQSGIIYALQLAQADGHMYLPAYELTERAALLLGVDAEWIPGHYMNLAIDRKIVTKGEEVYLASGYYSEENCAAMLHALNRGFDIDDKALEADIADVEKFGKLSLDDMQRQAVKDAARNGVFVLTGGPGTGKTTTIRALISYFENEGLDIALAAPTGRAAKRMSEATDHPAKTIHRLLEVKGGDGESIARFDRNESNYLEADVIIIDEMSMVDVYLFMALLKAVPADCRLILVGDANQLPSVGPGNVLKDILAADVFASVKLSKIFRQDSAGDIVVNAHKIQNDEPVILENGKSRDFFLLPRYSADIITAVTLNLIQNKLPSYVNAGPLDIQVLTPTKKGLLGVENLNIELQKRLNPPAKTKLEKTSGERTFREGDKVMQTKNNYDLVWEVRGAYGTVLEEGAGIFNGDMGIIKEINSYTETILIEFDDGRLVDYPFKDLDELELAYAVTIHKSQGSEYPAVIIPLLQGPRPLMNKNLIYTAVTRAKSCVCIVGDEKVFREMCENRTQAERYSGLKDRILEMAP